MSSTNLTTNRGRLVRELDDEVGRKSATATVMFQLAVADRLGLGLTDLVCGEILSRTGLITAGELAELSGLTTGAVTGVVDRLEREGFVVRVNDPHDRRRVMLQLRGERFAEQGMDPYMQLSERFGELLARFDERELTTILEYLTAATAIFDEEAAYWRAETAAQRKQLTREQAAGSAPHADKGQAAKGKPRFQVKADIKVRMDMSPRGKQGSKARTFSAPLSGDEPGHLEFVSGTVVCDIGPLSDPNELYRARFEDDIPTLRSEGNAVSVRFRQRTLFGRGGGHSELLLNPAVPWDFKLECGASELRADLAAFHLRGWELESKASHIWLNLPAPNRTVEVRLTSGESKLEIYRPVGVPVRVETEGEWSSLYFDAEDEAIGDAVRESPDYAAAKARYHIVVRGRSNSLRVQERQADLVT